MTESNEEQSILSKDLFLSRLIKSTLTLLILGIVFIALYTFSDIAGGLTDVLPDQVAPASVAGGAIILVALTLMGVPIIPAAIASLSVWWLIQNLMA